MSDREIARKIAAAWGYGDEIEFGEYLRQVRGKYVNCLFDEHGGRVVPVANSVNRRRAVGISIRVFEPQTL